MDKDLLIFLAIIFFSLAIMFTNFTLYLLSKRLSDLEKNVLDVDYSDPRIDQKFG